MLLIEWLKRDLTNNSLQNTEGLKKVASHFGISIDKLIDKCKEEAVAQAFRARNIIVHQMDVNLELEQIEYNKHDAGEVEGIFNTIKSIARSFIKEVEEKLKGPITEDYEPLFTVEDGVLMINC